VLSGLWTRLLDATARKLPGAVLDSWLRPCRPLSLEGDHLTIAAPNRFTRDWLIQHHLDVLQAAAAECIGGHPRVSIVIDDAPSEEGAAEASAPATAARGGAKIEGLNPRYTFDTFVVGSSNQFAQAACQAVAELPSRAYNPLFIYGGVGLGKTH
jgi:chromosomal replication initiator protein